MSVRGLALHAQRVGSVFAHPATWSKLIRERGWRRPRLRLYPAKPKIGLRTHAPNEAWHIDVSLIKLLDGTKAYVHVVIDNFSRRILAWIVVDRAGVAAGRCCPVGTVYSRLHMARKTLKSALRPARARPRRRDNDDRHDYQRDVQPASLLLSYSSLTAGFFVSSYNR